jgi:ribosome-associated toxin RatA of RatAB toxin-antitoxin module
MKRASQSVVIEATPQECFDAITDYESFPDWQDAVKAVQVVSRDRDGRGREVQFEIDAKVKTVRYTLAYSYEAPAHITWDYLDGDVKDVDGEYTFEDQDDGTTLATYELALDPGVWLPGKLQKMLSEQVMKGSVEDLKRRVEGG